MHCSSAHALSTLVGHNRLFTTSTERVHCAHTCLEHLKYAQRCQLQWVHRTVEKTHCTTLQMRVLVAAGRCLHLVLNANKQSCMSGSAEEIAK
jgi:hypothetical protein